MNNTITQLVLSSENYVEVSPETKNSFEYQLSFLIKNEIRNYKWFRGEEGKTLTWDEAKNEWMKLYYKDFTNYIKENFGPKKARVQQKRIADRISNYSFERRNPVTTGHLI